MVADLYRVFHPLEDSSNRSVLRTLHKHSITVACAAEILAERSGDQRRARAAFAAGLMHAVGKMVLAATYPKSYARVVDRVRATGQDLCEAERGVLGLSHIEAGRDIATQWNLPRWVIDCIRLHSQGSEAIHILADRPDLVSLVRLANAFACQIGIDFPGGDLARISADENAELAVVQDFEKNLQKQTKPFFELFDLNADGIIESMAGSLRARPRFAATGEWRSVGRSPEKNRLRDAFAQVWGLLAEDPTPANVCAAAAAGFRVLLATEKVLVFAGATQDRQWHVGLALRSTGDGESTSILIEKRESVATGVPRTSRPQDAFAPATQEDAAFWQRCWPGDRPRALWSMPIRIDEKVSAGAIVSLAEEPFETAPADVASFANGIGALVRTSLRFSKVERSGMDLLELHRRSGIKQAEVVRERALEMVAEMAAGAAHELNNPLAVISGRAQMELIRTDDLGRARTLEIIVDQTRRASQIVDELMAFARPEPPEPALQSLGEVLSVLSRRWKESFALDDEHLRVWWSDSAATVYADPVQLEEILEALVANAVTACEGREPRIQINSPGRASDEKAWIVVEDNGSGMSPRVLDLATAPFFSSRPAGRGRGLGLSRASRLVALNGGSLRFVSKPEQGTRVTVELPAQP